MKSSEALKWQQATINALRNKFTEQNPSEEGVFYSPANGNWYSRPLAYNNEYINHAWTGSPSTLTERKAQAPVYKAPVFSPPPRKTLTIRDNMPGSLSEIYRFLDKEQAAHSIPNLTQYSGQTVAGENPFTMRAKEYIKKYADKAASGSKKKDQLLKQQETGEGLGIGEDEKAQIKALVEQNLGKFSGDRLRKILVRDHENRGVDLRDYDKRTRKDRERAKVSMEAFLKDKDVDVTNLDRTEIGDKIKYLDHIATNKGLNRKMLIDTLEQKGEFNKNIEQKQLDEKKERFKSSVNKPYNKIKLLAGSLEGSRGKANALIAQETAEKVWNAKRMNHFNSTQQDMGAFQPTIQGLQAPDDNVIQGLNAYLGTNYRPTDAISEAALTNAANINAKNNPTYTSPSYVAGAGEAQDDLLAKEAGKGSETEEEYLARKRMKSKVLGPSFKGLSSRVAERIKDSMDTLEHRGARTLKERLSLLNNRFINLGQYGSQQHHQMGQSVARKIQQEMANSQQQLIDKKLTKELERDRYSNALDRQHGELMQQNRAEKDMGKIAGMKNTLMQDKENNIATQKRLNEQKMQEIVNKLYVFPHLRESLRNVKSLEDIENNKSLNEYI